MGMLLGGELRHVLLTKSESFGECRGCAWAFVWALCRVFYYNSFYGQTSGEDLGSLFLSDSASSKSMMFCEYDCPQESAAEHLFLFDCDNRGARFKTGSQISSP